MKISGLGTIKSSGGVKKRGDVTSATAFADILAAAEASDVSPSTSISDVAAATALNNLLSLQEISEEDIKRRKLAQQGFNLLDSLEQLRSRLLIGTLDMRTLQEIERQLSVQKQLVNDPKLTAIIEDIELRAAVELAKLKTAIENNA